MKSTRLEAFSDGVIAIIITIMVLELKAPHEATLAGLMQVAPVFLYYAVSFFFVAIYWVNHHHLIHLTKCVDGPMLWYNLLLLFCLSLLPFVTAYLGESHMARLSVILYDVVSIGAAFSFYMLRCAIMNQHHGDATMREIDARLLRRNRIALGLYLLAFPLVFLSEVAAMIVIVLPSFLYFMPERRVEKVAGE